MYLIFKEGSDYSEIWKGKATVIWEDFINKKKLILEVTVQSEGEWGRQTKRGTSAPQRKRTYEQK